ncbi:hypothetical protein [Rhodococcus triatomae]
MIRRLAAAATVAAALTLTGCTDSGQPDAHQPEVSLTDAPQIASWSSVGGVWVPIGTTDGPSNGSWEPFHGFSRTPQGAALAAITQSVQLATASDNDWPTILGTIVAPGEARDTYAANRALISIEALDSDAIPDIVGYTITDYTDTAANIDIVQRFSDDSLATSHTRVVWTGEDWHLELPTNTDATITALDEIPTNLVNLEGTRK